MRGERHTLLRHLQGQNAVEHIDSAMHTLEELDRCAYPHTIARERRTELGGDEFGHGIALAVSFSDGETANGKAVEGQGMYEGDTLLAEIGITRPLDDAEQRLR